MKDPFNFFINSFVNEFVDSSIVNSKMSLLIHQLNFPINSANVKNKSLQGKVAKGTTTQVVTIHHVCSKAYKDCYVN